MPYVPPHLRGLTPRDRFKAIVVPKIGNKFVVFRYTGTTDLTFPGGGCGFGNNLRNCALKELREESKNSIRANKSNLKNMFYFSNKNRSKSELKNNMKKGINVTMHYHGYLVNLKNDFDNIKRRYNSFNITKVPNRKAYSETDRVKLKNLKNLHGRLWMGNKIIPHLKSSRNL
jgi:hypothetical protein